jgi:hypothetical protein
MKIKEIFLYDLRFANLDKFDFLKKQLDKITEEYNELRDAIIDYMNDPNAETLAHMEEESWDLAQVSFGIPNNMLDKYKLEDSNHKHVQKLIERDNNNDKRNSNKA